MMLSSFTTGYPRKRVPQAAQDRRKISDVLRYLLVMYAAQGILLSLLPASSLTPVALAATLTIILIVSLLSFVNERMQSDWVGSSLATTLWIVSTLSMTYSGGSALSGYIAVLALCTLLSMKRLYWYSGIASAVVILLILTNNSPGDVLQVPPLILGDFVFLHLTPLLTSGMFLLLTTCYDNSSAGQQATQQPNTPAQALHNWAAYLKDTIILVDTETDQILYSNRPKLQGQMLKQGRFPAVLSNLTDATTFQQLRDYVQKSIPADDFEFPTLPDHTGSATWYRLTIAPMSSSQRLVTLSDVTAQYHAKQIQQEMEMQLRAVFDGSLDVIFIIDDDERIRRVNPVIKQTLGYDPEDIIGQHFSSLLPEQDHHPDMPLKTATGIYNSMPFNRADGSTCQMELTATMVPWQDDFGILITLRDVTAREEMRRELKRSQKLSETIAQERELLKARENMIFVVAHQLRNPLSVIQTSTQLVQLYHKRLSAQKIEEHLDKVVYQVKYLDRMVDNMLTARDALLGKLDFKPLPVKIRLFCRRVFNEVQQITESDKHTFILEDNLETQYALLDENLLTYILENLLVNAAKYSPDGGIIKMTLNEDMNWLYIDVRDTGIGIPQDMLEDIFQLFTRGSNVGKIKGTGIGLALAYNSAKRQGGDLTVTSEVGKGTQFRLTLPKVEPKSTYT